MFGKQYPLFRLMGFQIRVDASWFLLALLITWTLASGFFPSELHGLAPATYWLMGVAGAIGFFLSIVLHELSHSLVGRHRGIPMKAITLFLLGGVSEMEKEPPTASTELLMAGAGPLASIVLAVGFYVLYLAGSLASLSKPWVLVLGYLAIINGLLAVFNLIPAFPLDGGRIFRAILWRWKHNLRWATRVAARTGSVFAVGFIALGALDVIAGNLIDGVWLFLIGIFLYGASGASYQQLLNRQILAKEKVRQLMASDPVQVPRQISIRELVEDYIYRHHVDLLPVVTADSVLLGWIGPQQLRSLPRQEWDMHTVGELTVPCSRDNTIDVEADALTALNVMNRTGHHQLLVRDQDQLAGVITQNDMLRFLALKLELEDGAAPGPRP